MRGSDDGGGVTIPHAVMPAHGAGIRDFERPASGEEKDVDGRHKACHDTG